MKNFIKNIPFCRNLYNSYYNFRLAPERKLTRILGGRKNVLIVQIGSNDGCTTDPIYSLLQSNKSWKALLVEPVPDVFMRLKQNYPDSNRFTLENVAIDESEGFSQFYSIDPAAKNAHPDLPIWFDQISSFDRNHIHKHFGTTLDDFVITLNIPTLSLMKLLERNHIKQIDILHIDTEGHDWIILRQLDLNRFKPEVILFEHKHLTPTVKQEAVDFLDSHYKVTNLGNDYFCHRRPSSDI